MLARDKAIMEILSDNDVDESAIGSASDSSNTRPHRSAGGRPAPTPGCHLGKHNAARKVTTDASGVDHARCRDCGCELTRMTMVGRWFRSGKMG
ncbi:hypothetical protein [Sphingomonas sp. Root710]|uniref:hypothetical protein n=1 Tax=Sphingomonas sp. Root710 TaxID=1736594 RepID=UPI0012E38D15|nr:hypothetical protein [Sphingomonas sp. Root710]